MEENWKLAFFLVITLTLVYGKALFLYWKSGRMGKIELILITLLANV